MWIIWGRDRHHHALTAHGRARKRGRWSGTHLPAQGSSGGVMYLLGSGSRLPAQGSSGGATCPRGSGSHLSGQGSSGGATYPRGSGSHLST
jgi:hypothetical protein